MATGADPSGPAPTTFLWMPNCSSHEGSYDEAQYQDSRLINGPASTSLRQWLEAFVAAPATGVVAGRVDRRAGYLSECAPRLGSSGFE